MSVQDHENSAGSVAIINRQRELRELRLGLDEARNGRGRIFTFAGEPGIGKSRLAEEAADYAVANGARVLWGRCCEEGGAPAYWPWVQVARELANNSDVSTVLSWTGAGASEMAQIVPELREMIPSIAEAREASLAKPEQVRFRLFDSFVSFLRRASDTQLLMIVLEDLHAADATSLMMLAELAKEVRKMRAMVIGTYREAEIARSPDRAALIAESEREGIRLPLRGLREAEIGEFIRSNSGVAPTGSLISALGDATDGNPFFLSEMLRTMAAEGQFAEETLPPTRKLRTPAGVSQSIRRRVAPLGDQTNEVLAVASVIGREFDIACLECATQVSSETLLEILDTAGAVQLVAEIDEIPGGYRFCHALVREALYDALPTTKRRRLHRVVADALRSTYRLESRFTEIAYHYCQAAPSGDAHLGVEYARRAARLAERQWAYEEATRHLGMALEVLPLVRNADEQLRTELLLELGKSQAKAGLLAESRKTCLQAADLARTLGHTELFARAVVSAGRPASDSGTTDTALVTLLMEASAKLDQEVSPVRAQVLARLGIELYWSRRKEGVVLCQQAVDMAARIEDPHTSIVALWAHHLSLRNPDSLQERLADTAEIIRIAEQEGERDFALEARFYRIADLLEYGDITGADLEHRDYLRAESELRDRFKRGLLLEGLRAILDGRLSDAESLAQQAFAAGQESKRPLFLNSYMVQNGMILWERGRLAEMELPLRDFIARNPLIVFARCGLLLGLVQDGRGAEARAEFAALAANEFELVARDWNWLPSMFVLSDICADLGNIKHAEVLYRYLGPYADRNATLGNVYCYGSISFALGRLAALMGRMDDAASHFEKALAANHRIRAAAWEAHTQQEYAATLLKRGTDGDRARARELLTASRRTARAFDLVRLQVKLDRFAPERAIEAAAPEARAAAGIPVESAPTGAQALADRFRREGEYWSITSGGRTFLLKHTKGLGFIAQLLLFPNREFHSLDLVAGRTNDSEDPAAADFGTEDAREDALESHAGLGDAGEMLDPKAKAAYRHRLSELRESLDDARELGNAERAAEIEDEIDALAKELSRAVGLGGRDRRSASASERARLNVTRAIRTAIEKISEHDRALGILLGKNIRTGIFCSYVPAAEHSPVMRRPFAASQSGADDDPIEAMAAASVNEPPELRGHVAPDGTVAILFTDVVDCSPIFERFGDLRAHQILAAHNAIVREHVAAQKGYEVKSMGDGFMIVFSSARRALLCAIGIQQAFVRYREEHRDEPLNVRMGLHVGETIKESSDFFGKAVILAARIAALAQAGEILLSSTMHELTSSAGDLSFAEVGDVPIKGLSGTHRIYRVVW